MKKFIKSILGAGVFIGLILAGGEADSASVQFTWSFGWLAFAVICGYSLVQLFPNEFKNEQI